MAKISEIKHLFKRKIYSKMLAWKEERNGETALLIEGARRIGKSTIAEVFAANEYKSYIAIDFGKVSDDTKNLFNSTEDLDFIFLTLQSKYNVELVERKSVIIFDEIQLCPAARQAIKYLVEDGRYDYIETGSLITINQKRANILVPSEETKISMFPLDFEEFLWATGCEQSIRQIKYCYEKLRPMGDVMHREMMKTFRKYMLIGGMPKAVSTYLDTNNLARVDAVKREIIELYLQDLHKIDSTSKAARIFGSIPGELCKNKLRYELGSVLPNVEPGKITDIWQDLEDSMTVNFCYRCLDPNVGMQLHKDENTFKLYMGDTGLFITLAFWDEDVSKNELYDKLLSDKLSADLGYVYENAVAQALRALGKSLFYYTMPTDETRKKFYEVDFVISSGLKIIPIEVKSSGYRSHKSLDEFAKKFSSRINRPITLYTKDLQTDNEFIYLPVYMTFLL